MEVKLEYEYKKYIEFNADHITYLLGANHEIGMATLILTNFIRCTFCASVIRPIALDNEPSGS